MNRRLTIHSNGTLSLPTATGWEMLPRLFLGASGPLRAMVAGWEALRRRLREGRFDAVWVHGWGHVALCQAVREAAALGLPVLLRGESLPNTPTAPHIAAEIPRRVL